MGMFNNSQDKCIEKIYKAIVECLPLALVILLMLCLPNFFPNADGAIYKKSAIFSLVDTFAVSMVFSWWSRKSKVFFVVLIAVCAFLLFLESYCYFHLFSRLTHTVVFLVLQSDSREIGEFLNTFLFSPFTLKAIIIAAVFVALAILAYRIKIGKIAEGLLKAGMRWKKVFCWFVVFFCFVSLVDSIFLFFSSSPVLRWLIWAIVPSIILTIIFFSFDKYIMEWGFVRFVISIIVVLIPLWPVANQNMLHNSYDYLWKNSVRLFTSDLLMLKKQRTDNGELLRACKAVEAKGEKVDYKIVVVIGESYSKPHSSLYGYRMKTNPFTEREEISGNLIKFDDCISRRPLTSFVLYETFSTWSLTNNDQSEKYPLFPSIFRKLGYNVSLIDNQARLLDDNNKPTVDFWDFNAFYFYSYPEMSNLLFDHRNAELTKYDFDLVKEEMPEGQESDLTIMHLYGQHMPYEERFPKEQQRFNVEDYSWHPYYSEKGKVSRVAGYDNSTCYNDSVMAHIYDNYRDKDAIVFYFSDHGEEVYDFRDVISRTQEPPFRELLPYLYEVPYTVWVSDTFKTKRPEIVEKFKEASQWPIVNSDISHVLIDLAGIETPTFDPTKSYLNPLYDKSNKRLLYNGEYYEDIRGY